MDSKLRPCPFCGCTETNVTHYIDRKGIQCGGCGALGPTVPGIDAAIAAWNRRAGRKVRRAP